MHTLLIITGQNSYRQTQGQTLVVAVQEKKHWTVANSVRREANIYICFEELAHLKHLEACDYFTVLPQYHHYLRTPLLKTPMPYSNLLFLNLFTIATNLTGG